MLKSHGCSKCLTWEGGKKSNSTDVAFSPDAHGPAGWTWSSLSGLRSREAAAASPSDHHTPPPFSPPYHIRALKNTLSNTHEPPVSFPGPTETHIFVWKSCFFAPFFFFFLLRSTAWRGSLPPLPGSYLPDTKRRGRTLMWTQVTIQIQTEGRKKSSKKETTCMEWSWDRRAFLTAWESPAPLDAESASRQEERFR